VGDGLLKTALIIKLILYHYLMFNFFRVRCFGLKIEAMNRIKEVLETKGIKQVLLVEKLGESFNMVNSYVQNRTQPSLEVLYRIAEILEIDVKELLISNSDKK